MASCLCQYRRRILLCLCTPCILLACLFIYIALAVCLTMTPSTTPVGSTPLPPFFIASGATNSGLLAPYPINSFWKYELDKEGHWNMIQHIIDRQHNPILHPRMGHLGNDSGVDNSSSKSTQKKVGCFPNYDLLWSLSDYFSLPSQMQRFVIAMHCRDYPLIVDQPRVCSNASHQTEPPMLLLAIKSQAPNFDNRQAIRKTWGRSGLVKGQAGKGGHVRRVFLLAKNQSGHDLNTVKKLKEESKKFGDIIMWDFLDAFFNLTLKDILFWDWFSKNCQTTRFVFKGDDDVFLRTPVLLDYLQNVELEALSNGSRHGKPLKDFYVGEVITSAAPLRSQTTKYFIPDSFYKGIYPSYAGGGGVVYSGALVLRLLEVSKRVHLFPIDDVYLGMCLQRLGVIPIHHPAFLTFDFPKDEGKKPCAHHTIVLVHKRSPKEIRKLWVKTQNPSYKCRKVSLRTDPEEEKKETLAEQSELIL